MTNRDLPLLRAPHRGFFLLGGTVLVAGMAWWLAVMVWPPRLFIPAGWLHAWLTMFGMFAPFIGGFLFTAYPRWLGAPPPGRAWWLTSLSAMALGTLLFTAGGHFGRAWAGAGVAAWTVGWTLIMAFLIVALRRGRGAALHAGGVLAAGGLGLAALLLLLGWLWSGPVALAVAATPTAFWGFLMGIYLVVAHRMLPFFSSCVLDDYRPYRPPWVLLLALGLSWSHLALLLAGLPQWLWLVDAALAALAAWLAWRWQFWRSRPHRLLAALYLAWFALVAGMAASAAQSLVLLLTSTSVGGRAPEHLIGIGFFGALVIAMGTRVTLGHSGRPLRMGPAAWWAVWALGGAAMLRLLAEFVDAHQGLILLSGLLWLAAALAWSVKHLPMLLAPRVDGKAD